MRYMKWIGLLAAALLVFSCFLPWVVIGSKGIVISGVDATGTNYGKPGYFNLLMAAFFLFFHFVPKVWAKRANLAVVALNIGWTIRNFYLLTACHGGECPEKKTGLFLLIFSAVLMLAAALFPDLKMKAKHR